MPYILSVKLIRSLDFNLFASCSKTSIRGNTQSKFHLKIDLGRRSHTNEMSLPTWHSLHTSDEENTFRKNITAWTECFFFLYVTVRVDCEGGWASSRTVRIHYQAMH